jgi:hypothetical protein
MAQKATAAMALGRIAGRGAGKSRFLRAVYRGVRTAFCSLGRVIHLFFLQLTGLVFCLFAVEFAVRIPSAYRDQLAGRHGPRQLYLLAIFAVTFAWFGVTSFWRARKN